MNEAARQGSIEAALRLAGWRWTHFRPAWSEKGYRTALKGDKGAPDPQVPAKLRRLGKDMGGLVGKVSETTGKGMRKVAGEVVDGVKTAAEQIRKPKGGGGGD